MELVFSASVLSLLCSPYLDKKQSWSECLLQFIGFVSILFTLIMISPLQSTMINIFIMLFESITYLVHCFPLSCNPNSCMVHYALRY